MPAAHHIIDGLYGYQAHKQFEQCFMNAYPGISVAMGAWRRSTVPDVLVSWDNGAYIRFRFAPKSVHIQELVNSKDGQEPEGLYRYLVHESGLPELFVLWGIDTITCEPSDDDARAHLRHYSIWETWHSRWHEVWVWWLMSRTVERITYAVEIALAVQGERRE